MEKNEIIQQVKECVIDILIVEDEDMVKLHSCLADDLGAESIDFVEIIMMLSRTFDTQIERSEVYPDREYFTDEKFITADRSITDAGAEKLVAKWPHLNRARSNNYEDFLKYIRSLEVLVDFIACKVM